MKAATAGQDRIGAPARFAQGSIVLRGAACQPGIPTRDGATNQPLSIVDYGNSGLHRGVLVELALHRYADGATLTSAQTNDPAIQERFKLREGARNVQRLPNDWATFRTASCLVRAQPEFATRLLRSEPGSDLEKGLVQAILVDCHTCLGQPKRLTIDTTFFRGYIADAYYRWLVAAQNVSTLIPENANA